ncbi:b(0,+)-type amino acid transporter 1 [Orchesella cincta]|uniref:b(0,+)-type amino acid transporter 1 n=1 Tax=Orchesella cincta TaxID=48709 RepID=A0A1D2MDA4_ORCCI|nr:b(0,+)-type amino acid transporter 1 [Orchesella cincta]
MTYWLQRFRNFLGNNNATRRCIRQCNSLEAGAELPNGLSNGGGHRLERSFSIPADTVNLKRRVGLFSGVALIIGTQIGSGIFVSPREVLMRTGSVGMFLVVWLVCGLMSLLGALAYAELGTMNPSSGAEYAYFLDAFGPVPAFLFSWVSTLVLKPSQLAIICLTFAQYSVEAFLSFPAPEAAVKLVCLATIALILFINCYSVDLATGVQNMFCSAKLIAIGIVCLGGLYKFASGHSATPDFGFTGTETSLGVLALSFYSGLWAYDGWNLPRSIILGIPLVTACYLFINVAYLFVMTPEQVIESEAVAVTFADIIMGNWSGAPYMRFIIPLCVAISTFGAANGTLFVAGRLCFATSREGQFSDILSYITVGRYTPIPALIFHAVIAGCMVVAGNIGSLIDFFSFSAWIFYGGAMLAVIVQRFTRPDADRPYKVPIIIPWVMLIASTYLVVAPIIDKPQWEYLYATMFIVAGLIFYIPFVHYKLTIKFMVPVTIFLQKLFMVAPTDMMEEERCFL